MGSQEKKKAYSCAKGRRIVWVHAVVMMCRAGGRCTAEQPRPRALRLSPEKLEGSQMQLIPKPLEPQLDFSTFKPQLFQCHSITSWNYSSVKVISGHHKKPYLFSTVYRTSNWYGLRYVCPSMNKGLRALSPAYYCGGTNGGIKYILNRGHLKL